MNRSQIMRSILCGRMTRMDQRRWPHAMSKWDVRIGERKRGQPKTRWADTLKKVAEGQRSRTAKNTTSLISTSLQIAHLVIKKLSSPWFHQEIIALMELI